MEQKSYKILVCGDANGKLKTLYTRVSNILKKSGDFEMLLCVGKFFGTTEEDKKNWEEYKNGISNVPIVTYILGPCTPEEIPGYESVDLSSGGELCENITYLGRCGILQCPSGLQVGYVSGMDNQKSSEDRCCFKEEETKQLSAKTEDKNFKGIDLFLTSDWPKDVTQYGNKLADASVDASETGSEIISKLAVKLRPRYHFTALDKTYYERLPYRNHQVLLEPARHVTRFISLANVGNGAKKKYLYAFNIVPLCHMKQEELVKQPDDVTEMPYSKLLKKVNTSQNTQQNPGQNFFFDMDSKSGGQKRKHEDGNHRQPTKRKGPPPIHGPCWFCLGGSQVEKHLVVSVADHVYLAMAKGGLTPDHTLICPIAHYPSTVELPDEALMEIEKYKSSLRKLFKKQGYSCVIYERNFYTQHLQIQVIPVPREKAEDLKSLFMEMGSEKDMEFDMLDDETDLKEIIRPQVPFFLVEFEDGSRLLHRVRRKMPLQFGREVLASPSVLDMVDRTDWKSCKVSMDDEKKITGNFRKKFQPFDFSLA